MFGDNSSSSSLCGPGATENWMIPSSHEGGQFEEELENQTIPLEKSVGGMVESGVLSSTNAQPPPLQRAFGEEIGSTVVNSVTKHPSMPTPSVDDDEAGSSWVSFGPPPKVTVVQSSVPNNNKSRNSLLMPLNSTQSAVAQPLKASMAPRTSLPATKTLSGLQQRRIEKSSYNIPSFPNGGTTAAATTAAVKAKGNNSFRSYTTPVRIQTKEEAINVQATNDGYASVAKLSAWLADDPTRSKTKVRQIRRGANVIAKSRKFDKALANVKIIEEELVLRGHVKETRHRLEHHHSSEDDTASTASSARFETASAVSVQDKTEWLTNAFKRGPASAMAPPKAMTDVGTRRDDVEDVTARAKSLWRQRTPPRQPEAGAGADVRSSIASKANCNALPIPMSVFSPTKLGGASSSVSGSEPEPHSHAQEHIKSSVAPLPVPSILQWDAAAVTDNDDDSTSLTSFDVHPNAMDPPPPRPTASSRAASTASPQVSHRVHSTLPPATALSRSASTVSSPQLSRRVPSSPARPDPDQQDNTVPSTSPTPACSASSIDSPARDHRLEELQQIRQRGMVRTTADIFTVKPVPPPVQRKGGLEMVDDPDRPLDFQAARDLIIRRSKKNGNSVEAVSKVGRRKAQFEKLHIDQRRKSLASSSSSAPQAQAHLKASWRPADGHGSKFGATITYKKTYVPDLAPKKSFEALP